MTSIKTLGHGSSAQDKKKSSYKTQNNVKGLDIEVKSDF